MEIRANYILVGLFTILAILGCTAFILWTAKHKSGVQQLMYEVHVNESVQGLSVNSDVLFSGIKVGSVSKLTISPANPGEVRVLFTIAADTPVRQNSIARLELKGITGQSVVSISGGTSDSPLMPVLEDAISPIAYEPSPLSTMVTKMPDIISSANILLNRFQLVVTDENLATFNELLASSARLATNLANASDSMANIVGKIEKTVSKADTLLSTTNKMLGSEIKSLAASLNKISKQVETIIKTAEPGLKQFFAQGLGDYRMLATELRNLVHIMARVSQKIENDPRRFFFGESVKEYDNR